MMSIGYIVLILVRFGAMLYNFLASGDARKNLKGRAATE